MKQMGWGVAGMSWPCRNPRGQFTLYFMGMASPRGGQKGPGMGNFPDNLPISLLGLVMEPRATCTWKTQEPQSQGCCSDPTGTGRRPLKVGTAALAVIATVQKTPQGLGGISRGCSQTPSLPALYQGRSQFGWDVWWMMCTGVLRSSFPFPPPPSHP